MAQPQFKTSLNKPMCLPDGAFPIFAYTPQGLGPARLNAPALPGHGAAPLYATWGRWGRDAYRRDRQADAHL
jgi:hypothetical protein